jgi:hypothetical protein
VMQAPATSRDERDECHSTRSLPFPSFP